MLQANDSSHESNVEEAAAASLQPMGFIDILDSMFSLYRNHFRLFLSISVVYFLIAVISDLLIGSAAISVANSGELERFVLIFSVLLLIECAVMLYVIGALVFGSAQVFLGVRIDAGAAFRQAKRRFGPYLAANFLYVLVVVLLTITIIGIPIALFFGLRWVFCSLAALFEEHSAVKALKRSSELVKGGWWRIFGMMIGIFLLVFFVQSILQISLLFVLGLPQTMGGDAEGLEMLRQMFVPQLSTWADLIGHGIRSFVSNAIAILMLPVGVIGATLVYFDRRIRKEGFDIEMRVTSESV
ncbi:MAG: hypothetical protein OXN17_04305 [Candidatus Poribacteria bacterium]|nr:hypothetical protein [Candidatus Poribacteria bacterium]MDE0505289.1 hypothetical protein [Candidatus Poribacteria bacterium]